MLVVLLFGTILLAIASFFLFKKNVLSPSFLLSLVFSMGSLLALLGNTIFWHEDVSYMGTLLILTGLLLFMAGEYLVDTFLFRKHNKEIDKRNSIPKREVEMTKGIVVFLVISFFVGLAINAWLFYETYKVAVAEGYKPGYQFFNIVRHAFHNGHRIPPYVAVFDFFVQGFGFVAIFLGVRQFFGGKKRYCLFYAPLLIPLIISQILSTGRNGFVLDAVLIVTAIGYFGIYAYKKITLLELTLIGIITLNVFFFAFFGIGLATKRIRSVGAMLETLFVYGGSSIIALDRALFAEGLFESAVLGSYSFNGFYSLFIKFFPSISIPSPFLPSIVLSTGIHTNLYTMFMAHYLDFGLYGCLVASLLSGAIYGTLKNVFFGSRSNLLKLVYFYFLYSLVYSLFNPLFSNFLSVTSILQVVMMTICYLLVIYSKKVKDALKNHKIAGDVVFAFVTQGVSLLLSLTMSLVVPKILNLTGYSYWQLFMFYSIYVGIFHFGFIDGIYLRLGGKNKEDIDKHSYTSQLIVFAAVELLLSAIVCAIWCPLVGDQNRVYVILFTAIYLIFSNLGLFFGYIFQAIGRVKTYSISIFIEKLLFLISIFVLLLLKVDNYLLFIILYVAFRFIFFAYLFIAARKVVLGKPQFNKDVFKEMWESTRRGFFLMVASLSSLLIMGVSRALIDAVWGLETFGIFSFSISLCSFALAFLAQISMVFFPALRRIDESRRVELYLKMRKFALLVLPLSYFAFFIIKVLVAAWLPTYLESISLMVLLLPICLYDGKMQMISNTYFKVFNKERTLLYINLIGLSISAGGSLIFAFAVPNMIALVVSMMTGIIIRSILSDYFLSRLLKVNFYFEFILETAITLTFVLTATFIPDWASFLSLLAVYTVLLILNRKTLRSVFDYFKSKIDGFLQEETLPKKRRKQA